MQESVIWVYVLWSCSPHSTLFKIWSQSFMTIMDIKILVKLQFCLFILLSQLLHGSLLISSNMLDIKKLCLLVHLGMLFLKLPDCWLLLKCRSIILLFGLLFVQVLLFVGSQLQLYGLHKVLIPAKLPVKKEKVKCLDFFGL